MAELAVRKVIRLHGIVTVDETTVASLTAEVSSDITQTTQYSESIVDPKKYYANRDQVREQISAFRAKMFATEDKLVAEKEDEDKEEELEDPTEEPEPTPEPVVREEKV